MAQCAVSDAAIVMPREQTGAPCHHPGTVGGGSSATPLCGPFIRAERAPRAEQGEDDPLDHFMVGPPDLAVEVRSPSERLAAVRAKAARWLAAGTSDVWIIDGRREVVHVPRREATPVVLHKDDTLTAPDVLPGFATSVASLFARRR